VGLGGSTLAVCLALPAVPVPASPRPEAPSVPSGRSGPYTAEWLVKLDQPTDGGGAGDYTGGVLFLDGGS
jgi:hypothetical protein